MASITVNPDAYTSDNDFGTASWSGSVVNLQTSNNAYVSTFRAAGSSVFSQVLLVTPIRSGAGLGQIPAGSTINGIQVRIERKAIGTVTESSVILYKEGIGYVGSNKASGSNIPTSDTYATYGGASDLWGTTWTRDEVVNSMRVGFQVGGMGGGEGCDVDHVEFIITFSPPIEFSGSTTVVFGGTVTLRKSINFICATVVAFGGVVNLAGGLVEFSGSTSIVFGGSVMLTGGIVEFSGSTIVPFGGSVIINGGLNISLAEPIEEINVVTLVRFYND